MNLMDPRFAAPKLLPPFESQTSLVSALPVALQCTLLMQNTTLENTASGGPRGSALFGFVSNITVVASLFQRNRLPLGSPFKGGGAITVRGALCTCCAFPANGWKEVHRVLTRTGRRIRSLTVFLHMACPAACSSHWL